MSRRQSRWRLLQYELVVGALVIVLCAVVATFWALYTDRVRAIEASYRGSATLANAIQEHAGTTFELAEGLTTIIASTIRDVGGLDAIPPRSLAMFIERELIGARGVASIVVLRPDGGLVAHSHGPTQEMPDRLMLPEDLPTRGSPGNRNAAIGKPIRAATSGQWIIPVTRGMFDANGDLTGYVIASVSYPYLRDFYVATAPHPNMLLALVNADGTLLARAPPMEEAIGTRTARVDENLRAIGDRKEGRVEILSARDNVTRLFVFNRADRYPLVALVAEDLQDVLAPWRKRVWTVSLLVAVGAVVLLAFMGLLAAQARRLEVSEERFLLAARGAAVGIWDHDLATDALYLSPQYLANLGYLPGELQANYGSLCALVHPEDLPHVQKADEEVLRSLGPVTTEFRLRAKDGTYRWFAGRAQALRNAAGQPARVAGSVVDIHQRKLAEIALAQSNEALEARVQERTMQLASANTELALANKELESFSYTVSHDLRAPVRHVMGYAQMLREALGSMMNAESTNFLDRLTHAARRMDALIQDLLALSQVGRHPLKVDVVDLSAMTNGIIATLKDAEPDRAVTVTVAPGLLTQADPGLLHIVLENLLGNAWKFTRQRERAHIIVGREETDSGTAFFVRDDGAGFDMRHAGKLFEPFQRMHSEREFEGTGIGLSIVQRAIVRHGGRVWAHSEEGRGTTIYFTLPAADQDSTSVMATAARTRTAS